MISGRVEYSTSSAEETVEVGRKLASEIPESAVVLLIGNLGAGKTTLAQGIISGRGAAEREDVASPTFTLIHEYGGENAPVYHIDLYRLDEAREVEALGLDEIFNGGALVLIEWGERFPALMPRPRYEIRLTPTGEDESDEEVTTGTRRITVDRIE